MSDHIDTDTDTNQQNDASEWKQIVAFFIGLSLLVLSFGGCGYLWCLGERAAPDQVQVHKP